MNLLVEYHLIQISRHARPGRSGKYFIVNQVKTEFDAVHNMLCYLYYANPFVPRSATA